MVAAQLNTLPRMSTNPESGAVQHTAPDDWRGSWQPIEIVLVLLWSAVAVVWLEPLCCQFIKDWITGVPFVPARHDQRSVTALGLAQFGILFGILFSIGFWSRPLWRPSQPARLVWPVVLPFVLLLAYWWPSYVNLVSCVGGICYLLSRELRQPVYQNWHAYLAPSQLPLAALLIWGLVAWDSRDLLLPSASGCLLVLLYTGLSRWVDLGRLQRAARAAALLATLIIIGLLAFYKVRGLIAIGLLGVIAGSRPFAQISLHGRWLGGLIFIGLLFWRPYTVELEFLFHVLLEVLALALLYQHTIQELKALAIRWEPVVAFFDRHPTLVLCIATGSGLVLLYFLSTSAVCALGLFGGCGLLYFLTRTQSETTHQENSTAPVIESLDPPQRNNLPNENSTFAAAPAMPTVHVGAKPVFLTHQRIIYTFVVLAMAFRLAHWLLIDRVWEDGLITLQHAENAARGLGLTHHPAHGLVHGFTSALNVLLPLGGELLHPGWGLGVLRFASVLAAGGTILFAGSLAQHPTLQLSRPALVFLLGNLSFDHQQILYGMAGMETQLFVCSLFAVLWAWFYQRWSWLTVALIAIILSRPDSLLVWGLVGAFWVLQWRWRQLLVVSAWVLLGLLPWLSFTTWYYGSPVPHTVVAKNHGYRFEGVPSYRPPNMLIYLVQEYGDGFVNKMLLRLLPYYVGHGGPPHYLIPEFTIGDEKTKLVAFFQKGVLLWLLVGSVILLQRPTTAFLPSLVFFHLVYLLLLVRIVFHWYVIGTSALCFFLAAVGVDTFCRWLGRQLPVSFYSSGRWLCWSMALFVVATYVLPLPITFLTDWRLQAYVDGGVRRRVGEWLNEQAHPHDTVAIECLGYVGYYSRRCIHDYPGLSSPEATKALREANHCNFLWPIVEKLEPDWLVLRANEGTPSRTDYELVHREVIAPHEKKLVQAWMPIFDLDFEFRIFKRRAPKSPAQATATTKTTLTPASPDHEPKQNQLPPTPSELATL